MIEFEHVAFKYPQAEEEAIKNINITINDGEWVAILGHNGSGKSTLAKLTNGLLMPTEGSISVNGLELTEEHLWKIRRIVGMVFQNPENQFVGTTVLDDVAFGLENLGISRENMQRRIIDSLDTVGMSEYKLHEPFRLSGGQKQRVAIASVLAIMPEIMIFDEATTMLDPVGRRELIRLIQDLHKSSDLTFLSITHDMNEAILADRIIVLNDGELWFEGKPSSLLEKSDELEKVGLLPPLITDLTDKLRKNGVNITTQPLNYEELVKQLWILHSKM
ncbi:energy-coupling factor transporter ATPase [Filobacillus milosensis]|uniref:Energy-coupling factor transporter ATPase n=1 Tax=Filobacillus milosensis TaxID=94137 RepID=A0A4Y8ILE1_9BACI|nr:energy-coupling factor transporter ATPase [Filobacillus milosensis]TFB14699.1 energy-coupling factor transporter ATPase [Filobacillus milosensis]